MGVFIIFFGWFVKLFLDGLFYLVFYLAVLVLWSYFAMAVQSATNVVVENQQVITKVYFPRILLPASSVAAGLVDFSIVFVVLFAMTLKFGIVPGVHALFLPLFLLLAVATALGVGLWLSALNALYRDVHYVTGFLVQFWMLASPVAYPSSLVPQRWRLLYHLNPMAGVIDGFRWALTGHGDPPGAMLLVSAAMVLVLLTGGLIFFRLRYFRFRPMATVESPPSPLSAMRRTRQTITSSNRRQGRLTRSTQTEPARPPLALPPAC